MAKKFVLVSGLNKVFSSISTSGAATILASVSATADANSILYITATADDSKFSAPYNVNGSHWIWAKGQLYDGNTPDLQHLTSNASMSGDIGDSDSLENVVRKMLRMIEEAKTSGVTSLTTHDDSWIIIDPDLSASTGAVSLNVSHGLPGTASTGVKGDGSTGTLSWGGAFGVKIPNVSIDARGHVSATGTDSYSVTLPSTPVTALTTAAVGNEIIMTANTNATGAVTVNASHALHTAQKAGQTADATLAANASSFKVLEVSTNGTGHVISATAHTITLPETAFSDTTYTFGDGTQSFTYKKSGTDASVTVNVNHMAKGTGSATGSNGTYISAIAVDDYGHVTGADVRSNGVYTTYSQLTDGEIALWTGSGNSLKKSNAYVRSIEISADSSRDTLPTTSQVIDYVLKNKVQGAMTFKGTKATYAEIAALTDMAKGDVWVLSADDATSGYQRGDTFIWNGESWERIPAGDAKVVNRNASLTFGTTNISIGNIDGTELLVNMPSETALTVDAASAGTAGATTYVTGISKGTGSHEITVTTSTLPTASTSVTGIVKLVDSSTSTSTTEAVTPNALNGVRLLATNKSKVSYVQSVAATADASYLIGTITIDGTATPIYGHDKDTVYIHPAAPSTGSAATASAGTASATVVATGVTIDASGHIASVATSNIAAAYNMREIKVNGTTTVNASNNSSALDISAGDNVNLTSDTTNHKITISSEDEKVKATEDKTVSYYLIGQTSSQVGTANTAEYRQDVYAESTGALHATSLYEGSWSVHDSSAGDWGTIS